jgi:hypothetical protein
MRILDDAAATRVAAAAAADVRITPAMGAINADTYGDDPFGRAFAAAIVRVHKRICMSLRMTALLRCARGSMLGSSWLRATFSLGGSSAARLLF